MAGLALLTFALFWVTDALVDSVFFYEEGIGTQLIHASPYEIYIRTLGGGALAIGLVVFLASRNRSRTAAREITRQKDLYQALVDASPECILIHSDLRLRFANRNTLDFFGLGDPDPFQGASLLDFVAADGHAMVKEATEKVLAGTAPLTLDLRARRLDGSLRDVQTTSTRLVWDGEPAVLTFFRDITTENQNRRNLLASRERLQLALDAARDGVWDWDIASGKMVYSESWAGMLGYPLSEISDGTHTWRSLIHPHDLVRAQTLVDTHLQGLVPGYEIEVRLRHRRGHYIWVLDRGRVVERDEQGNPLRMTGTHRDITARKEAEIALEVRNQVAEAFLTAEQEEIFAKILEVVCGALEVPLGLFTTLNSRGKLVVMATRPALSAGQQAMDTALSFDRRQLPEVFARVIEENRFFLSNHPLDLPGHRLPIHSVLGVPISNRDQVLGAIYVANKEDGFQETDRFFLESLAGYIAPILQSHLRSEAKEEQLRQAHKMEALGALAGGIAHDFNNILQAIMGFTTLALEDAGQEGTIPGDLARVLKATRRGQELVQRILIFSRRDEQKRQPLLIQNVVAEAINLLKPSIPATIEIRSRLEAADALVLGDPGQISQVILNLATNAYHAMEPGGGVMEIALTACRDEVLGEDELGNPRPRDLVALAISDTGTGMSDQIKARLFDPFFTTKQVGHGTGLGMSMVHGIVQSHGGEIRIDSQLDVGTKVTVFWPRITGSLPAALPAEGPPAPLAAGEGKHLVIVDDEQDITDLGKALLERTGHRVTAENNGRVLLDRMAADPAYCDLVITDLTMPQITGLQLAAGLLAIRPDLPVILITGMTEQAAIDLAGSPNIKGLIRKPFGGDTLRLTVDRILEEAAAQKGR